MVPGLSASPSGASCAGSASAARASPRQNAAVATRDSPSSARAEAAAAVSPRSPASTETSAAASSRASSSRAPIGSSAMASLKARKAPSGSPLRTARIPIASMRAGVGGVAARNAAASVASISAARPSASNSSAKSSQWSASPGSRWQRASARAMADSPATPAAASSAQRTFKKRRNDVPTRSTPCSVTSTTGHSPSPLASSASSAKRRPARSTTGHSPAGQFESPAARRLPVTRAAASSTVRMRVSGPRRPPSCAARKAANPGGGAMPMRDWKRATVSAPAPRNRTASARADTTRSISPIKVRAGSRMRTV